MSFYINEFKKHLQQLSDQVDHPYDEPARRHLNNKTTGSLEEAYQAMNQPRVGSYQRPAPTQLNEQYQSGGGTWSWDVGNGVIYTITGGPPWVGSSNDGSWGGVFPNPPTGFDGKQISGGKYPPGGWGGGAGTHRPYRGGAAQTTSNYMPRKDTPMSNWGGGLGGGGGTP